MSNRRQLDRPQNFQALITHLIDVIDYLSMGSQGYKPLLNRIFTKKKQVFHNRWTFYLTVWDEDLWEER